MDRFTILLAGPITATPELRATVAGTRTIAADAGIVHAAPLGIVPELWVGDFDSTLDPAGFADVPREIFPCSKDKTDGELAIEAAIARGAGAVLLVGAFGGPRTDHAIAHLVLALGYAEAGIDVELFDGRERAWPLRKGVRSFALEEGAQFSILKFSDVHGLSIRGAKYPLDDVSVPFRSILTQSNEAMGPVEIGIGEGRAVLLAQADPRIR